MSPSRRPKDATDPFTIHVLTSTGYKDLLASKALPGGGKKSKVDKKAAAAADKKAKEAAAAAAKHAGTSPSPSPKKNGRKSGPAARGKSGPYLGCGLVWEDDVAEWLLMPERAKEIAERAEIAYMRELIASSACTHSEMYMRGGYGPGCAQEYYMYSGAQDQELEQELEQEQSEDGCCCDSELEGGSAWLQLYGSEAAAERVPVKMEVEAEMMGMGMGVVSLARGAGVLVKVEAGKVGEVEEMGVEAMSLTCAVGGLEHGFVAAADVYAYAYAPVACQLLPPGYEGGAGWDLGCAGMAGAGMAGGYWCWDEMELCGL